LTIRAIRYVCIRNGLRIHSMSAIPTPAGKRGDASWMNSPSTRTEETYSIAYPHHLGGRLESFPPSRQRQLFNDLVNEVKHKGNPKGFSLHTVSLQNALDEGFLYKLQTKLPAGDERQDMDEADYFNFIAPAAPTKKVFSRNFAASPDDQAAFLSYDLIASCQYSRRPWEKSVKELALCQELYLASILAGPAT